MNKIQSNLPTWSPGQSKAIDEVAKWYNNWHNAKDKSQQKQVFRLFGYAGTGKTTLAKHFAKGIRNPMYASFTGKAALQMSRAGCLGARTIHSLIYMLDEDDDSDEMKFTLNPESALRHADLLIVDEVSMVNSDLGADLLSFRKPILVLGDPGQLPPIHGTGFFTKDKPDCMLNEIHRQALDNPIIRIADSIRKGRALGKYVDDKVMIYPGKQNFTFTQALDSYEQIITGKNDSRRNCNAYARKYYGRDGSQYPLHGDRIICLRNNKEFALFNGLIGTVSEDSEPDGERVIVSFVSEDDRKYKNIQVHDACFTDPQALEEMRWQDKNEFNEFDYGYAVTCHKAQGSQWDTVVVVDDGMFSWDRDMRKRWLYTAVTRAAEKLVVVRS